MTSIYDCSVINLFLDIQNLNKIANVYVFFILTFHWLPAMQRESYSVKALVIWSALGKNKEHLPAQLPVIALRKGIYVTFCDVQCLYVPSIQRNVYLKNY